MTRPGQSLLWLAILSATLWSGCAFFDSEEPESKTPEPGVAGCDGQRYAALEDTPYVLPFPSGTSYQMNLGNCSSSYHAPQFPDRYAYDFGMPIGTTITAARAGRVVRVVQHGVDGDSSVNNLVVVDHNDGTYAEYMHLTNDGARVAVDDNVEAGDVIGLSGNTGLAGYPHLHFVVVKDDPGWPYEPVPVSFRNAEPRDVVLNEGVTYLAR